MQYQQVAAMQSQRWRLASIGKQIAITDRAIFLCGVANRKRNFQGSILAAQILRLWHRHSRRRTRAGFVWTFRRTSEANRAKKRRAENNYRTREAAVKASPRVIGNHVM